MEKQEQIELLASAHEMLRQLNIKGADAQMMVHILQNVTAVHNALSDEAKSGVKV